uniref:Uncharacterized protein n=1 Tax=Cannabis sativa TaxID=3483 RepID=A0A803PD58_CANSA
MSSIGASCAGVYVMQKRQKEKTLRMEEERARKSGETHHQDSKAATRGHGGGGGSALGKGKKVHPGNFSTQNPEGSEA